MTKDLDEQLEKVKKQIYQTSDGRFVIKKEIIGESNGNTSK